MTILSSFTATHTHTHMLNNNKEPKMVAGRKAGTYTHMYMCTQVKSVTKEN